MDRLLYSRKEAAERLSVSISTLDMLLARGKLPSRKIGRKRLIPHAALVAFSQKNLTQLWPPISTTGGKTWTAGQDRNKAS
jgi:excisionase family DNA binding protein